MESDHFHTLLRIICLCLAKSFVLSIRTSIKSKYLRWAYHEASEQVQEAAGQLVLPPHWA